QLIGPGEVKHIAGEKASDEAQKHVARGRDAGARQVHFERDPARREHDCAIDGPEQPGNDAKRNPPIASAPLDRRLTAEAAGVSGAAPGGSRAYRRLSVPPLVPPRWASEFWGHVRMSVVAPSPRARRWTRHLAGQGSCAPSSGQP